MAVASDHEVAGGVFCCCVGELVGWVAMSDLERPADSRGVEDVGAVGATDLGECVLGLDHRAGARSHRGAGDGDRLGVLDVHHRDRSVGRVRKVDRREQRRVGTDRPVEADHDRTIGHRDSPADRSVGAG